MLDKHTLTASLFLAPLVLNKEELKIIYLRNCLGTFYQDTNKPEWENKIILAFELTDAQSLKMTEDIFKNNKYSYDRYVETIDNKTYYIYAYLIPHNITHDVEHLINGEYTKLSDTTKSLLLNSTSISWLKKHYEAYFTKKVGMTFTKFHEEGILNLNKVPIKKGESNDSPFYFIYQIISVLNYTSSFSDKILHFSRNIINTMNLFECW